MRKGLLLTLMFSLEVILFQACDFSELIGLLEPSEQNSVLYFDGDGDIITIPDADLQLDSLSREITLEAWVEIEQFYNEYPRIIDRSDNIKDDRFILGIKSETHQAHLNINGSSINSDDQLAANKWYHIAGTYNGTELKLYINGKLQGIMPAIQKLDVSMSNLYIGNNELLNRAFNGKIAEIAIWNLARSSQQILNDYRIGILPFSTGLVSHWKFDKDNGQIVQDMKGNNNGYLGRLTTEDPSDPVWVTP